MLEVNRKSTSDEEYEFFEGEQKSIEISDEKTQNDEEMSNTQVEQDSKNSTMDTDELLQVKIPKEIERKKSTTEKAVGNLDDGNGSDSTEDTGDIEMECIERLTGMSMNNSTQRTPRMNERVRSDKQQVTNQMEKLIDENSSKCKTISSLVQENNEFHYYMDQSMEHENKKSTNDMYSEENIHENTHDITLVEGDTVLENTTNTRRDAEKSEKRAQKESSQGVHFAKGVKKDEKSTLRAHGVHKLGKLHSLFGKEPGKQGRPSPSQNRSSR